MKMALLVLILSVGVVSHAAPGDDCSTVQCDPSLNDGSQSPIRLQMEAEKEAKRAVEAHRETEVLKLRVSELQNGQEILLKVREVCEQVLNTETGQDYLDACEGNLAREILKLSEILKYSDGK